MLLPCSCIAIFIAQRPSMNVETLWYLHVLEDPLEMSCFIYLNLKRLAQNSAGSIPAGIPIYCLKAKLPIMKKHLFMRKDIALARV